MFKTYQLETKNGNLQVRTRKPVIRNGKVITSKLHRHVISPGDDYSKEPGKVRRHCKKLFTPARIKAHKAEQKAREDDTWTRPLKDVDHVETKTLEDDTVLICKCTEIYEDGEYYDQHHDNIEVEPGTPVTNAPELVNDILAAAHVKTAVKKHRTQKAYKAAKQAKQEAVAAREAAVEAKQKAVDAGDGVAEARQLVTDAKAAVQAAQAALAKAKTARDKARADHQTFIDSE